MTNSKADITLKIIVGVVISLTMGVILFAIFNNYINKPQKEHNKLMDSWMNKEMNLLTIGDKDYYTNYDSAIRKYKIFLESSPVDYRRAHAMIMLGLAYFAKGDRKRGKDSIKRVLEEMELKKIDQEELNIILSTPKDFKKITCCKFSFGCYYGKNVKCSNKCNCYKPESDS